MPGTDVDALMDRVMWYTPWHSAVTGRRHLRSMCEMGVRVDANGKPVNPSKRHNGRPGRGLLGKWGVNHVVEPVVTTFLDGGFHVLCTFRPNSDGFYPALPGGTVEADPVSELFQALKRELVLNARTGGSGGREGRDVATEVATEVLQYLREGTVLFTGISDDPRNTRNAWVETIVLHAHVPTELALRCNFCVDGEDDGQVRGAFWMHVTDLRTSMMCCSSHERYVRMAEVRIVLYPILKFLLSLFAVYLVASSGNL